MHKKSEGLPFNIIIIAAIGLTVLIILAFILRGESSKFVKSTNCPARSGICLSDMGGEDCPDDKSVKIYTNDCLEVEFKDSRYIAKEPKKSPGQCCAPLS